MQLHTYLSFDGTCRDAFESYQRHLGGKITAMMTWKDGPMADQASPEIQDRIMHAALDIDGHILMGSDSTPMHPYRGNGDAHVVVSVPDPEQAERIFQALSEGGRIEMPMEETFWARRFGMTVDRFDVPWMVNCNKEGEQ